jgi:crotonobetainyl-CoA:carnitine CoA-transferase CaiB-like acyl-CoA transferase
VTAPLAGITVVEVAGYIFVPTAGAVLADLGAEVIKVEPLTGDPMRQAQRLMADERGLSGLACLFEGANRGKQSIALDLRQGRARDVLERLVRSADVFATSYLPGVRRRLRVDLDDIRALNPDLIYARGSGWGDRGPMRDVAAYDMTAAWASSGAAAWFGAGLDDLPQQPYGFYDVQAGHALAGAIGVALFQRERTGVAPLVDVSLVNVGWWAMQAEISAGAFGTPSKRIESAAPSNPLVNWYSTADDRWLVLSMAEGDHWWVQLCERLGRQELASDARFATGAARAVNNAECAAVLRAAFRERTLAEWQERFDGFAGAWSPVLRPEEVARHPQAAPNGFLNPLVTSGSLEMQAVATPLQLDGQATLPAGPTPAVGQQTDQILTSLGFDGDEVAELRAAAVVA